MAMGGNGEVNEKVGVSRTNLICKLGYGVTRFELKNHLGQTMTYQSYKYNYSIWLPAS